MKRAIVIASYVSLVGSLSGCVSGAMKITPPSSHESENSKVFKISKDRLWASLIPAVGKSFFVINTVDKSSGIISLSYSTSPERYLDCGHLSSQVKNARGPRSYEIDLSSANSTYEVLDENKTLLQVSRKLTLEGKINLIVESLTPSTSKLTVNAKYVVQRTARWVGGLDYNYRVIERNGVETISFDSGGGAGTTGTALQCFANGRLEREILDLIKQ